MARETREVWTKRVERWRDSGLTAKEFAAEIGVNYQTLQHWSWKLGNEGSSSQGKRRRGRARRTQRVPVVEVVGTDKASGVSEEALRYEVVLASGVTVRVPSHFDDSSLGRLLSVLEAR